MQIKLTDTATKNGFYYDHEVKILMNELAMTIMTMESYLRIG
jgi:hypothetical protein